LLLMNLAETADEFAAKWLPTDRKDRIMPRRTARERAVELRPRVQAAVDKLQPQGRKSRERIFAEIVVRRAEIVGNVPFGKSGTYSGVRGLGTIAQRSVQTFLAGKQTQPWHVVMDAFENACDVVEAMYPAALVSQSAETPVEIDGQPVAFLEPQLNAESLNVELVGSRVVTGDIARAMRGVRAMNNVVDTRTGDLELDAMRQVAEALEGLDNAIAGRILDWAVARFDPSGESGSL
jgi:hypothetical protein